MILGMKKHAAPALIVILFLCCTSFHAAQPYDSPYYIEVSKSRYELKVYDAKGWLATYPVVFGNKDLRDKLFEGDRKTPEGSFTIISKRHHPKWSRMILLDYPTKESQAKFNQRKLQGLIPANAKIGGGIGIHGTWPNDEGEVSKFRNWTDGCVSMYNEDVIELYNMIPVGTKVFIKR